MSFPLKVTKLPNFSRYDGISCPDLEISWKGVRSKPWRAPLPLKASECVAIPPRSMALIPVDSIIHLCIDGAEKGYCAAPREEEPVHNDPRGDVLPFQTNRFTKRVQILSGPSNELEGPTHVQATNPTPFTVVIYSGEHVADFHFTDSDCVLVNPRVGCTCGARRSTDCLSNEIDSVLPCDTQGLAARLCGAQGSAQARGAGKPLEGMGVVASGGVSPCRNPESPQVKCSTTAESAPGHSPPECVASRGLGMAALPDVVQYGHTGTPTPNVKGTQAWPTGEATRLCVRDRSCFTTSPIRPTTLSRGLEVKVDEFSKEPHLDPSLVPPPDTSLSSQTISSVSSSNQATAGIGLGGFKSLVVNLTNRIAEVLQGRRTIETEGGGLQIRSTLGEQEFSGTGGGTGRRPSSLPKDYPNVFHAMNQS